MDNDLTNLRVLKRALNLPYGWLHRDALAGHLPCLRIGRQLRFNFHAGRSLSRCEGSGLQPRPAPVGAVSEPQVRARGPPRVRSFGSPAGRLGFSIAPTGAPYL